MAGADAGAKRSGGSGGGGHVEPFIRTIEKEVPDADIVHDKYHVSSYLGKAVDQVRRQEHKELMAERKMNVKGSLQLWLYNPENFKPGKKV